LFVPSYSEVLWLHYLNLDACIQFRLQAKSVLTLPIDQLKAFPDPRYLDKPASGPAIGTPQKLFNWMDPHCERDEQPTACMPQYFARSI
jgi:hypothetical protein